MMIKEDEFSELVVKTRLTDRGKAMARCVLVNGENPTEVGKRFNVSRQRAADTARRVIDAADKNREIPEDWQRVTVKVNPGLARVIRYLERIERFRAGLGPEPMVPRIRQEDVEIIAKMMSRWARSNIELD